MHDFEAIRPYRDDEVAEVIQRLVADSDLRHAASRFLLPRLSRTFPHLARTLAGVFLKRRTRNIQTVRDVQLFLERYMGRLIEQTIESLGVTGLENLQTDQAYLFISNHRDIVMDSGLLNYVIHHAGHATSRIAVGDNLLSESYAADLMRLNKSFVVDRSATGTRAVYQALSRTSQYIRHSLEEGESVWIAQREGRAKDGFDRTDPALLKMLALAYRKELAEFDDLLERIHLIPVALSYELDPCDRRKAHELYVRERFGSYTKPPDEDLLSIVEGMTGFKGRVHIEFCERVTGTFADADALATEIDRRIVAGLRVFPTHARAAKRLGLPRIPDPEEGIDAVNAAFEARLNGCPEREQPYLLAGYANLVRNRIELNVG